MSLLSYYYFYLIALFVGFSIVIQICVIATMILFMLSIMAILRFFVIRHKQRRTKIRKRKIESRYKDTLTELLFFTFQSVDDEYLNEFGKLKRPTKNWQKKMITDLINQLKISEDFEPLGGIFNKDNFQMIMKYLRLYDFWEKQMTSGREDNTIHALTVLNALGEGISGSVISQSVYSRKGYLRKYARSTFARFDLHDPFKFLEKGFDKDFNKFDELRIHYILSEISKDRQLPEIAKWIKSAKSNEYKRFLVKETGYFEQHSATSLLMDLFNTTDYGPLRDQIVETLGQLKYSPAIKLYEREFDFASQDLQLKIVAGCGHFDTNTGEILPFLKNAYRATQYSEVKVRIVSLIRTLVGEDMGALQELSENIQSDFERSILRSNLG